MARRPAPAAAVVTASHSIGPPANPMPSSGQRRNCRSQWRLKRSERNPQGMARRPAKIENHQKDTIPMNRKLAG